MPLWLQYALAALLSGCVGTAMFHVGLGVGRSSERARWGLPAGDGKTDDTAAIQRLLDRAARGEVFLPPGTYRGTATPPPGATLCGEPSK